MLKLTCLGRGIDAVLQQMSPSMLSCILQTLTALHVVQPARAEFRCSGSALSHVSMEAPIGSLSRGSSPCRDISRSPSPFGGGYSATLFGSCSAAHPPLGSQSRVKRIRNAVCSGSRRPESPVFESWRML